MDHPFFDRTPPRSLSAPGDVRRQLNADEDRDLATRYREYIVPLEELYGELLALGLPLTTTPGAESILNGRTLNDVIAMLDLLIEDTNAARGARQDSTRAQLTQAGQRFSARQRAGHMTIHALLDKSRGRFPDGPFREILVRLDVIAGATRTRPHMRDPAEDAYKRLNPTRRNSG